MRYHEFARAGSDLSEEVWHGTPHRFDRFSLDHIGTGEGAAAYGWGLYFAGAEEVAEYYREKLSADEYGRTHDCLLDGKLISSKKPSNQLSPLERAALDVNYHGSQNEAIQELEYSMEHMDKNGPAYKMDLETLQVLKTTDLTNRVRPVRGTMYRVEIPDSDDYLLWDFSLDKQSPQVRAACAALKLPIDKKCRSEWHQPSERVWTYGPTWAGTQLAAYVTVRQMGSHNFSVETENNKWSKGVHDSLRAAQTQAEIIGDSEFPVPAVTGKMIYLALVNELGTKKDASLALRAAGVPGIKYLDQFSRGAAHDDEDATFNYVLFDDGSVNIKYAHHY